MKKYYRYIVLALTLIFLTSKNLTTARADQTDNMQNNQSIEESVDSNINSNTESIEGNTEAVEQSDEAIEDSEEANVGSAESIEESTTAFADNRQVESIKIASYPGKVTYIKGESLDLTGLQVHAVYDDGSSEEIKDYEVLGYDSNRIGAQTIFVLCKNKVDTFTVTVLPNKVTNIGIIDNGDVNFTLFWNSVADASRYDIYCLDLQTGEYVLKYSTYSSYITLRNTDDPMQAFRIKAVANVMGVEYESEFSDPFIKATPPNAVDSLTVTGITASSISLNWAAVDGATGYLVYRSLANKDDYKLVHITTELTYTDTGLTSATGYKYKVCAYVYTEDIKGGFSPIVDISTNPAKPVLKYKAGEQKVRLTWSTVTGVSSYELYIGSADGNFELLTSISGGNGGSFIAENLTTGEIYQFYIIAKRQYNGEIYESQSDIQSVLMEQIPATSNTPLLYPTEEDFYNSWAYQKLTTFFSKYVKYDKSYAIPGLITTNVGGFSSTRMCPQGLTFASDYLLMSAYDLAGEENSVIYVVGKNSKELLTTLILPSKPHVGGLAFDGSNVWLTIGSRVAAIPISVIKKAAKSNEPYVYVDYSKVIAVGFTASYCSYYDGKLWIGTYNELQSTNMYSFVIDDKDTDPKLTKKDTIVMPNRVQGVAFTDDGTLIISRSCQTNTNMRGFLRQIDVYKPKFSKPVDGTIPLGDLVNSVSLPSMNEGIAINGKYLYVTYESAAFEDSIYKMDRITAFKLTDVVKKKKTK